MKTIRSWFHLRKRVYQDERGTEPIEWIAMVGAILVLVLLVRSAFNGYGTDLGDQIFAHIICLADGALSGTGGGDCGGGECSFSADTWVDTKRGLLPISSVKPGDLVLGYDEVLGKTGEYPVTAVLKHRDTGILDLIIDGEHIRTTANHPFFTPAQGWVLAGDLRLGAHLQKASGAAAVVQAIQVSEQPQDMYNLTVAHAHTFFVGEHGLLVHNDCGDLFRKAGIKMDPHFLDSLRGREGHRGISEPLALRAYDRGRLFYDPQSGYYIRYDPQTGVVVVVSAPSNGTAITVFQTNTPNPRWNPVPWRPGR